MPTVLSPFFARPLTTYIRPIGWPGFCARVSQMLWSLLEIDDRMAWCTITDVASYLEKFLASNIWDNVKSTEHLDSTKNRFSLNCQPSFDKSWIPWHPAANPYLYIRAFRWGRFTSHALCWYLFSLQLASEYPIFRMRFQHDKRNFLKLGRVLQTDWICMVFASSIGLLC